VISKFIIEQSLKINLVLEKFFGVRLIRRKPTFYDAKSYLLRLVKPGLVIDGGANQGQWALEILKISPHLRIISFEPTPLAFEILKKRSQGRKTWEVVNAALGNYEGVIEMNLASNDGQSSSILEPSSHLIHYPQVKFNKIVNVPVVKLDTFPLNYTGPIYLKLDVQGAEGIALEGARHLLKDVIVIELEIAIDRPYIGQMDFAETVGKLHKLGFSVFSISDPIRDRNGFTMFVDGIFVRNEFLKVYNEV
jgi:FkbM family methyltransferase